VPLSAAIRRPPSKICDYPDTCHLHKEPPIASRYVNEMSNPTRDGRAMIAAGMIHPAATPTTRPASPAPSVTIGAIRVSNRPASSAGGTQNSPDSE
jgi:hypothetical protein